MMRVSADKLDGHKARAWLNGKEVSNRCFEADDVEGWVDLLATDENGYFLLNNAGDSVRLERHYGEVRIELGGNE